MPSFTSRRRFLRNGSLLVASTPLVGCAPLAKLFPGNDVIIDTASGRVRGVSVDGVRIFKGIPYGGSTAGSQRFLPPPPATPWTGVRDALAYGPSAPQRRGGRRGPDDQSEDCLVLNVYTPSLGDGHNRPVMVWLHGGGFSSGSGSTWLYDGGNLARHQDVVVVTINHRLNALGFTYLADMAGAEFAEAGAAGMLDIVAALRWVQVHAARFGGDPDLVTIFGQSGGGRKVATLMAMPDAAGLFHRAIIQSGALLRLTTPEDAARATQALFRELGLRPGHVRELQKVPIERLLAANAAVTRSVPARELGATANTPAVDGQIIPHHPWDPTAPVLSADIPLLIGYTRTEETAYQRPTNQAIAMTADELRERIAQRIGQDPDALIAAYAQTHPEATPWDLNILIATDHPRGSFAREMAKRKADAGGAPAYFYRFDWETPEGGMVYDAFLDPSPAPVPGGRMRSPHTMEIPFVFDNMATAGPLIATMASAQQLSSRISESWAHFARTGDPNTQHLPNWPKYSAETRHTMLFNDDCRVVADPDQVPRLAMEKVLGLG
ncbi:MAG: carboxylesterase/lipase family protein [Xanthomonadales bacterium]|nr:carboxylesterase/lipase family protein [Xanthomonadales bacterium]MCB1610489.1 carboxylesterase/lipase family protein [Xanthomonadales bacterium]